MRLLFIKYVTILTGFLLIVSFISSQGIYAQDNKAKAEEHYQVGVLLYNEGKFKEAEEEFELAIGLMEKEGGQVSPLGQEKKDTLAASAEEGGYRKGAVEYVIGEGDSLLIKVWQNPDLDDEVMVRPDGMISFSLVGDIRAQGLAISEFKADLTEALKEYVKYPRVSVSIKKMGGKRVIVLGQVKSPGIYSVTGRKTILEAIGLAGGFNEDAVSSSVILVKSGFDNPKAQRLDLNKALKKGDLRANVVLESEDIVFVPRRFVADVNYFLKLFLDPISRGIYISKEIRDW